MPGAEAPSLEELDFASRVGPWGRGRRMVVCLRSSEITSDHLRWVQLCTPSASERAAEGDARYTQPSCCRPIPSFQIFVT